MLSRVRETSTTTGTGSVTVSGAAADHVTFNSAIGVNRRFPYYIVADGAGVWETGIGYMSSSTVLVRELITQNSSGTKVALSLPAGDKTVMIDVNAQTVVQPSIGFSTLVTAQKWHRPSNFIRLNSTLSLSADRSYYIPIKVDRPLTIDSLGVGVTTGSGTASNKIHLGLYDVNPTTGRPGFRIASVPNLDPSSAAFVSGTFTEIDIAPGLYIGHIWSDVTPALRANDAVITVAASTSNVASTSMEVVHYEYQTDVGLLESPAVGAVSLSATTGNCPAMLLGHS